MIKCNSLLAKNLKFSTIKQLLSFSSNNLAKIGIFLSISIANISVTFSQVNPMSIPDMVPRSPESAALAKFTNFSANAHTGTADISIPIFTVQAGNIKIPIELSYDASGIKVNQEATLVGLGWSLVAGGSISYLPVGGDERIRHPNGYTSNVSWNDWKVLYSPNSGKSTSGNGEGRDIITMLNTRNDYSQMLYSSYQNSMIYETGFDVKHSTSAGYQYVTGTEYSFDLLAACTLFGEGEQDIYSVNMINSFFKFIIDPETGNPFFIGKKYNYIIEKISDSYFNLLGFRITSDDGTLYTFDYQETATNDNLTNCWYLTRIDDIKGNWIKFKYVNTGSTYPLPPNNERYCISTFMGCSSGTRSVYSPYLIINNCYLTEIETKSELVKFNLSSNVNPGRDDIYGDGARRLENIQVYDKLNQKTIKQFNFSYDYFTSSNVGGDYLNEYIGASNYTYTADCISKRLKLTGLTQIDPYNANNKADVYSFTYNETYPLPKKTSFAIDYWGYYNGENNLVQNNVMSSYGSQRTMLPDGFIFSQLESLKPYHNEILESIKGANRNASKIYSTTGMLSSITYPTKGKAIFTFEPNIINANNYLFMAAEDKSNVINYNKQFWVWDYNDEATGGGASKKLENFSLEVKTKINIDFFIGNGSVANDKLLGSYVTLKRVGEVGEIRKLEFTNLDLYDSDKKISLKETIELDPGDYELLCEMSNTVPYTQYQMVTNGYISFIEFKKSNTTNLKAIGGGNRIKSIDYFDENNNKVLSRSYNYPNAARLKAPLNYRVESNYIPMEDNPITSFLWNFRYVLSSDQYESFINSDLAPTVGYDVVEIYNSQNQGKEVQYFSNYTSNLVLNRYIYSELWAGDMIKKEVYSNTSLLRTETYNYELANVEKKILNAYFIDNKCPSSQITYEPANDRYSILTYLSYNFFNQLKSHEIVEVYGSQEIKTKTDYTYNDFNQVATEITQNSIGGFTKVQNKYPKDYDISYPSYVSCISTAKSNLDNCRTVLANCYSNANSVCSNYTGNAYVNCVYPKNIQCYTDFNNCQNSYNYAISTGCSINYNSSFQNILSLTANDSSALGIYKLISKNILFPTIEVSKYVKKVGDSNFKLAEANLLLYKDLGSNKVLPYQLYKFENNNLVDNYEPSNINSSGFFSKSSNFILNATFFPYDGDGNLLSITKTNNFGENYIYGYNNSLLIAKATNATNSQIAYSSFENGASEGNWTIVGSYITSSTSKTGNKYCSISSTSALSKSVAVGKYRLEYWAKAALSITGGTVTNVYTSTADANGWILYVKEINVTSAGTLSFGGTTSIDEVRLYPVTAQMTTYTYDPLVGMTSQTDENNVTTYYIYDSFGRLTDIKDSDGKVLKHYDYHYKQ